MAKDKDDAISLILRNKKAFHDYEILEKLECGVVLQGTEVKSLRDGTVNLSQSYATVENGQLFLIGLNIGLYGMGNYMNHEPERKRLLLARKREIRKLGVRVEQKGMTLVPLSLYWKRGMCKIELGVARGKQLHDKRDSKKEKDLRRELERSVRMR